MWILSSVDFNAWVDLCNHYHNKDTEQMYHLKSNFLMLFLHNYKLFSPFMAGDHWSFLTLALSFWDDLINGMVVCVTFWDWLISLIIMPLNFIQLLLHVAIEIHSNCQIFNDGSITICLAIRVLKDYWAVSSFCQSWVDLLTFV